MSRRHHGRPRQHDRPQQPGTQTATGPAAPRPPETAPAAPEPTVPAAAEPGRATEQAVELAPDTAPEVAAAVTDAAVVDAPRPVLPAPAPAPAPAAQAATANPGPGPAPGQPSGAPGFQPRPAPMGQMAPSPATAPQLRRFIKSRPYVPMHELRRRFAIEGGDDDVTPVHIDRHWIFVGLPAREGGLLGELLRAGEIGYELSLDPRSPIVVGVYPMRPAPRP